MKLNKRGRMLVASYEAVRCQKLDLFSVTLRQIGAHISRMHLEDAIQVLMGGWERKRRPGGQHGNGGHGDL